MLFKEDLKNHSSWQEKLYSWPLAPRKLYNAKPEFSNFKFNNSKTEADFSFPVKYFDLTSNSKLHSLSITPKGFRKHKTPLGNVTCMVSLIKVKVLCFSFVEIESRTKVIGQPFKFCERFKARSHFISRLSMIVRVSGRWLNFCLDFWNMEVSKWPFPQRNLVWMRHWIEIKEISAGL